MRNIKTIEKEIERALARIQKNKDGIAKAQVRLNNAIAKCKRAGYEYKGDGNDVHAAYDMFKNWDIAWGPVHTADAARESIANKTRDIACDERNVEELRKEKANAEAEVKALPQALLDYSVKLAAAYEYEYKTRRDIAKARIKALQDEGKWYNYDYWKNEHHTSIWQGQEKLTKVANQTDEQIASRSKFEAECLVKDLHYRIRSYVGVATDYDGLYVTTGTQGYAVINGFITGNAGKCEVRSIECGGYNIVCWHIRVIVVRAK